MSLAESSVRDPCSAVGCGATLYAWRDVSMLLEWIQHGENREHRMQLTDRAQLVGGRQLVSEWLTRIHEYEVLDAQS